MESQLQCPVCTLFLHMGMDLQSHLDTHPKDQVIKALVNVTMTKKSNDPTTTPNTVHSNYAPIAEKPFTREVNQYLPEPIPRRPQQVLFGYSCSTRVFREVPNQQSTTTQKFITNALPTSHIVSTIPAQASFTNQESQKFPPPPYGSIVSKRTAEQPVQTLPSNSRYKLQSHQIGINGPRNGTLYLPMQNVANDAETVSEENVDEYANQTDQNIEFIDHCDEEEYGDDDGDTTNSISMDQCECPAYENVDPLQDDRIIRPNSVIYINDDESIDVKHETQNQKKFTEGLRVLSDVKLPTTVDILNLDCKFGESFKLDDVLCTKLQTDSAPIEVYESADEVDDPLVVGDDRNEFEMLDSAVNVKPSFVKTNVNVAVKCEIVAKLVKTELEGGEQQQCQNTEEVSDFHSCFTCFAVCLLTHCFNLVKVHLNSLNIRCFPFQVVISISPYARIPTCNRSTVNSLRILATLLDNPRKCTAGRHTSQSLLSLFTILHKLQPIEMPRSSNLNF